MMCVSKEVVHLFTMTSSFFTYHKRKVLQALRYHFISRKEIKWMIILINFFAIASAVLSFLKMVSPVAFLLASGLWFILMMSFWWILPYLIYKRASTFRDTFRVSLEAHHFFLENSKGGSKSWTWASFKYFMESPYFYHLYFDNRSFFLVPKSAFSEEDQLEVRRFLKEKINQS